jgi:hypothetical protein
MNNRFNILHLSTEALQQLLLAYVAKLKSRKISAPTVQKQVSEKLNNTSEVASTPVSEENISIFVDKGLFI